MPFYGYQYQTSQGLYGTFTSAKSISFDKLSANYLTNPAFQHSFHSVGKVPTLFSGTTFLSYDDEASIAEKAAYARSQSLGGIGAWELSHDQNGTLLTSAWNSFFSGR